MQDRHKMFMKLLLNFVFICSMFTNVTSSNCTEKSVRLINGPTNRNGTVEICYGGQWGTICSKDFFDFDGKVLCNELGFTDNLVFTYSNSYFGPGSGEVWTLDNSIRCTGRESSIFNCSIFSDNSGDIECTNHNNDVGIWCTNDTSLGDCIEGSIRLTNGSDANEGRAEVCYNGIWGGICSTTFGILDGQVVCRDLGYSSDIVEVFYENDFGVGNDPGFWLEEVNCMGNEDNILNCPRRVSTCNGYYVGIKCSNDTAATECTEGSIRLFNGTVENEGRLEVCYLGNWVSVCAIDFNAIDASVACTQLGFTSNGTDSILSEVQFNDSDTIIALSSVDCIGNESSIFQCTSLLGSQYCTKREHVTLTCNNSTGECVTGSIRLVNDGNMAKSRRVEVCFINQWGTVCSDSFGYSDARVACRQLGYSLDDASISMTGPPGSGYIWLSDLFCYGHELSIFDCPRENHIGFSTCAHSEDVSIQCFNIIVFDQQTDSQITLGSSEPIHTTVSLSCRTVNISGQLEWLWRFKGQTLMSSNHYQVLVESNTFSSTLVINDLRSQDSGQYTCYVHYQGRRDTSLQSRAIKLTLEAGLSTTPDSEQIFFTVGANDKSLICELSGYLETNIIQWYRVGTMKSIESVPGKYNITTSTSSAENSIDVNGTLTGNIISTLTIYNLTEADYGIYQCQAMNQSLNISLLLSSSTFSVFSPTPTLTKEKSSSTVLTAAIAGSIGSLFVLFVLFVIGLASIILVLSSKKRRRINATKKLAINANVYEKSSYAPHNGVSADQKKHNIIELKEGKMSGILMSCLIEAVNLKLLEKVGQGEFGIVYRGLLTEYQKNDPVITPVAVKTLKGSYSDSQINEIFEEAHKMKSFDHLNVLPMIGICLLDSPSIVMPFMSNGSLLSYLRKEAPNFTMSEFSDENIVMDATKQLLSMCLQVSKGMKYLVEQKFVHRDLAARNCMISADGIIKVADFGLAEDVYTTEYFKQTADSKESVKLPIKWMALESIHYGKFSEKTDMWSFGVLCWEVFSLGKIPYPGLDPRSVVNMLDNEERLLKPSNPACTEEIYKFMLSCWCKEANDRPTFSESVISIEKLLVPLAEYMDFAKNSIVL